MTPVYLRYLSATFPLCHRAWKASAPRLRIFEYNPIGVSAARRYAVLNSSAIRI